jgi:hypothetical protein
MGQPEDQRRGNQVRHRAGDGQRKASEPEQEAVELLAPDPRERNCASTRLSHS